MMVTSCPRSCVGDGERELCRQVLKLNGVVMVWVPGCTSTCSRIAVITRGLGGVQTEVQTGRRYHEFTERRKR